MRAMSRTACVISATSDAAAFDDAESIAAILSGVLVDESLSAPLRFDAAPTYWCTQRGGLRIDSEARETRKSCRSNGGSSSALGGVPERELASDSDDGRDATIRPMLSARDEPVRHSELATMAWFLAAVGRDDVDVDERRLPLWLEFAVCGRPCISSTAIDDDVTVDDERRLALWRCSVAGVRVCAGGGGASASSEPESEPDSALAYCSASLARLAIALLGEP